MIGQDSCADDNSCTGRSIFDNLVGQYSIIRALEQWCLEIAHYRSHCPTIDASSRIDQDIYRKSDTDEDNHNIEGGRSGKHGRVSGEKFSVPVVLRSLKFINIYGYNGTDYLVRGEVERVVRLFESECSIKLAIM